MIAGAGIPSDVAVAVVDADDVAVAADVAKEEEEEKDDVLEGEVLKSAAEEV